MKCRVDRRDSTQHDLQIGIDLANHAGCGDCHLRKRFPLRIDFEIPMREIVGFVPEHHRFNHALSSRVRLKSSSPQFQTRSRCYRVPAKFVVENVLPIRSRSEVRGSQIQVSVPDDRQFPAPSCEACASAAARFGNPPVRGIVGVAVFDEIHLREIVDPQKCPCSRSYSRCPLPSLLRNRESWFGRRASS